MPLYVIGGGGGGGTPIPVTILDHQHASWETPLDTGDRKTFRVTRGSYVIDSLDLAIAPTDANGNPTDYFNQFPPVFTQANPSRGLFTLADQLPPGWRLIVRYILK